MTHQVQILMPFSFLQPFVNSINHFFIRRFDALWIPDKEGDENLAGDLAHGKFMKKLAKKMPVQYLGTLSRMTYFWAEKKYRAIIVLSGPEPQRTLLEKKIFFQLEKLFLTHKRPPLNEVAPPPDSLGTSPYLGTFCFVRGVANQKNLIRIKGQEHLEIHDVLTKGDLNQKIMESEVVICRSGYSSLMDLVALQKKAILIPTEGQTEQEYLADILARQNRFVCQEQKAFNLETALSELPKTIGFADFLQENGAKNKTLQQVVRELLEI